VTECEVAIVAYQGVLADEAHAWRSVLGRAPGVHLVTVGAQRGIVAGPGGIQVVDATFADVRRPAMVVVPGGLGSHRHPEIAAWCVATRPHWVLTSSTGSALLAAAGVLRGRTAATHWLAADLLERHGVIVSHDDLVVDGPFVTCTGRRSAIDAATFVVARTWGDDVAAHIRDAVAAAPPDETAAAPPTTARCRARAGTARRGGPFVEVELEEHPPRR
jgi:transcriptional regulator GlxA family with amidase domain